jgi:hypothetical protein
MARAVSTKPAASKLDLSQYAWYPQAGPQLAAFNARWCTELFYGGARGGGKSDFLLGDFLQDVDRYKANWRGVLFRKTYDELEEIIHRSFEIFPQTGAEFAAVKRTWFWKNGAFLKMRYMERMQDAARYQGHQYSFIAFDELTNWNDPAPYDAVKACLRNAQGEIKHKRIRASGNPGGAGHTWVKERFVDPNPLGYEPVFDSVTEMTRMYVPAKVSDNTKLIENDPTYVGRLRASGSPELVRCWLEGDWNVVVGAYFAEFSVVRHVVKPFRIPEHWIKFMSFDWGSASPFSCDWFAVSDGTIPQFPRGALVQYRQWYGAESANKGLKLRNEDIARGILAREKEHLTYRVADPSIFEHKGGISIAEQMAKGGIMFQRGDNKRVAGWSQLRSRLIGQEDKPMIFWFTTCSDVIRTLPSLQHDRHNPEDLDTESEDHCLHGDTLVETKQGHIKIKDLVNTSGLVKTTHGWKPYSKCWRTRQNAQTILLTFSDKQQVRCTSDHLFLTAQGWRKSVDLIDTMRYSNKSWKQKLLAISGKSLIISNIIFAGFIFSAKARDYIGRFGNSTTERFLSFIMCIMSTVTGIITELRIYSLFKTRRTCQNIPALTKLRKDQERTLKKLLKPQELGMEQKRGLNGISKTTRKLKHHCTILFQKLASSVAVSLKVIKIVPSFALQNVKQNGDETTKLTPRLDIAQFVAKSFKSTDIQKSKHVQGYVEAFQADRKDVVCLKIEEAEPADVYCLDVPDVHNFSIEHGIIVHNCADSIRYACMTRPYIRDKEVIQPPRGLNSATFGEVLRNYDKNMNSRTNPLAQY